MLRPPAERRRLRVTGTVQGVGFRPFVFRHASALGLSGFVRNDSSGVLIEVQGDEAAVAELSRLVAEAPPPLARVQSVESARLPPSNEPTVFRIVESDAGGPPDAPVSVDTATCAECLAEVDDAGDRRSGYPFTNCTNCGPRYTIVVSVPYDRTATTMASFVMCAPCQAEYDDPADRRFHAQPNACPACGPTLRFHRPDGTLENSGPEALARLAELLCSGGIAALKGIGGYHLATDATDAKAVAELRRRKARDEKPFALMVTDLDAARALCRLDGEAEAALVSHRRPIVLAPRRQGARLADGVAPAARELGLMLPYSALHHLLMARVGRPLVLTSGNLADDPIVHRDDEVFDRLGGLVDAVVTHDRPIHVRCDDSVVRSTGRGVQMVRRSRGYAPEGLPLGSPARRQVLAVGAELKSTVSVAKRSLLVSSHHLGDLEHLGAFQSFLQATTHLCHLYGVEPDVVAHDLHPEYLSTKYALELDAEPWPVQHHHAHIASCLAEHRRSGPVLGIAFDGLGYGPDATLWGGEFLVADLERFERVGHLRPVDLPGGAAAIREPWRMALSWAFAAAGPGAAARVGMRLDPRWEQVLALVESGSTNRRSIPTTSAGRLFDAVAALVGLRSRITYEGQAAIELEALARTVPRRAAPCYPVEISGGGAGDPVVLDPSPLVAAVLEQTVAGTDAASVAAGFHEGLGRGAAALAARLARSRGLDTVALSGGVFQNGRLTAIVEQALIADGLEVLTHHTVPPNDGGISIGQAAIAATAERPVGPGGKAA